METVPIIIIIRIRILIAGKCADAKKLLSSLVNVAAVDHMWPCLSCAFVAAIANWSTWQEPPHQVWSCLMIKSGSASHPVLPLT